MLKAVRLACAAGVVALALFSACSSDQSGVPVLIVTANPLQLDGRAGSATQLTVEAKDGKGAAGIGQVTLTTRAGAFGDGSKQIVLTLANGAANTAFSCVSASDPLCTGQVRIDAAWGTLTYGLTIAVGGSGPDGGNPDGGSPDGGTSGVISLSASKSPMFFGVGDYSDITAQISTDAGIPLSGQTISFQTNLGGFVLTDGGTSQSVSATTGTTGAATARLRDTGTAGTAAIVAQHAPTSSVATLNLPILAIQAIAWVSTKCGGVNCTIMGIRGSGFNEQATVTFQVVDSSNNPAPGVNVAFSLTNPPAGTTVSPSGVTNAQGLVSTNVSVGRVIGVFTVLAVVIPNQVQVNSPPIGVRGAKPSNQGMVLDCNPHNIAAYVSPQPPADLPSVCKVTLVDRFGNPVGTGASVNFKSEAGTVPATISTVAYNPQSPSVDEGTGTFTFRSGGPFATLLDVPPLSAVPGQWPFPRNAEPSIMDGSLIRNPRDGLVSIIAYTRGEEYFDDNNDNGIWDPGERFFDQGEPLVDSNDNGVWDPGELYFDANGNGRWDGPNGVYDADTYVWTETRILYTDRPIANPSYSYILPSPPSLYAGPCPAGVARGSFVVVAAHFGDLNLNLPQSQGTSFTADTMAPKGSATIGAALLDTYGFQMERRLIDASSQMACDPASSLICNWKVLFGWWGAGYVGPVTINGAPLSDITACADNVRVTVRATVLSVNIPASSAFGSIQ